MSLYFNVFGHKIPAYGFFIAIGLCCVMLYLRFQKQYKELDFDTALSGLIYALVIGGIGAKILYWITDPESFLLLFNSNYGLMFRLQNAFTGGMVFLGGLIGAIIGVIIYLKKYPKLNAYKILDIFGVGMPILQMFGRVGCFFAGCCYGAETNGPLYVVFPEGSLAPAGLHLIPTQLFGVAGNLCLVIFLIIYSKRNKKPGSLFGLYLLLYSVGRFILEMFRGDDIRGIYGIFSTSQWLSIPIFLLGLLFIFRKNKVRE